MGAGSKSHPRWKACSVFPLFILDNSCTHTCPHTCLVLLSHLEHSPDLRNIRVRAKDVVLQFEWWQICGDGTCYQMTSSSLPLRTLHAFSFGPFPLFIFPSCNLSANEAHREAQFQPPPGLWASPAAMSMSPNTANIGCSLLLIPWRCIVGIKAQASPGIVQQNVPSPAAHPVHQLVGRVAAKTGTGRWRTPARSQSRG